MKGQYAEFGKLLRRLREERELTQDSLRNALNDQGHGIRSKGTISKWENGDSRPSAGAVEDLEDTLVVPRGTLLRPAGYPRDVIEAVSPGDPLTTKRREQHFDHLAEMADALLAKGLSGVMPAPIIERKGVKYEYVGQSGEYMTREQLSKALEENLNEADAKFGSNDLLDLIRHVAAEYEPRPKRLEEVFRENPFEFVNKLRILARRKTFKGTCAICKDW
ncbi:MAG: helix-turn-helix transcriptional regulator [Dehalococcoidia bacterium]